MSTSETLSTFFPSWVHQSRGEKHDPYFWLVPHVHPVLSSFYPFHRISGLLGNLARLDTAFKIFVGQILVHHLWASVGWYLVLQAHFSPLASLFGAVTFTYQAYHLKQQPCLVYTLAWFPWIGIFPGLAVGMMLLAGYYPLSIYLLPLGLILNHDPAQWLIGAAIGSLQLVPFLRYLPKTIKTSGDFEAGPWEKRFYFGLTPIVLLILGFKGWFLLALLPVCLSGSLKSYLPRVHQRTWLVGAYIAIFASLTVLNDLPDRVIAALTLLQCCDLWLSNRRLTPTRPFSELQKKPSIAFNSRLTRYLQKHLGRARISGLPFPLFTGHINRFRTLGYSGSMQLKLMAKWRNDTNPNGSGEHDFFRSNTDDSRLTRARVKFAYTRKGINWLPTEIKWLYKNPDYV